MRWGSRKGWGAGGDRRAGPDCHGGRGVELNCTVEALGHIAVLCLSRDQRDFLLAPFILAMASKDQAPRVHQGRYCCGE